MTAALGDPPVPALYECEVTHARSAPLRHAFRHRTYMWLVDLDALPRLPAPLRPLARFDARDHFARDHFAGGRFAGDRAGRGIRAGVDRFLAGRGIDLGPGGRVLMLAHARVLGYVFNPITVYWCRRADGSPACVIAEVHNTYGERHCYLLHPDERDRARAEKELYVSPFFPVDGTYQLRLPEPGARLGLSVRLEREGGRPLTAALVGRRVPATTGGLLRAALRHPWSTLAVSAHIRVQGIRLLLRGLPVLPRPRRRPTPGERGSGIRPRRSRGEARVQQEEGVQ